MILSLSIIFAGIVIVLYEFAVLGVVILAVTPLTACSMVTVFSYIVELIKQKKYKRVLVIATGALLSNTIIYQKETIPSIAHAYCLEYIDE